MSKTSFTWGEVISKHYFTDEAGKKTEIIKYYPLEFKGVAATGKIDYSEIQYHVEDVKESFNSYYQAIIAIVCNYAQGNANLTYPISRMLSIR